MASRQTAIKVNRAPVLTLWAAVVAEHLGFDRAEALTLGRAVAGLNAHTKGVALGIFQPAPKDLQPARKNLDECRGRMQAGEILHVALLRRSVPVRRTPEGLRALSQDRPIAPASVKRYLAGKFGDALESSAMPWRTYARP